MRIPPETISLAATARERSVRAAPRISRTSARPSRARAVCVYEPCRGAGGYVKATHLLAADDDKEPGTVLVREHGTVLLRSLVELELGSEGGAFD
jgi:hypothetical protein